MRYKLLGKSGLRVSEICLGTMTFGEDWGWGATKEESRQIFDAFMEAGGNFIDTANAYTNGTSETYLGEFIASDRDRVVLATKYTDGLVGTDPNRAGNHRKSMVQSVEGSLKRLNTDYIDLLWLHTWDFTTPIEEVLRAFDDLVRAGKVLYIGISDTPAWIVSQCSMLAELRGWTPFVGMQIEYSLIQRTPERELLPMAQSLDIGVTAWSPLANGWLTGKYSNGNGNGADSRRLDNASMSAFVQQNDRNLAIAQTVDQVAQEVGCTSAQAALNWLRQQAVIPIVGARKVAQVKNNLECINFKLSPEQMDRLNGASAIELGFPHDFLKQDMVKQFVYGGMADAIDNHRLKQVV